MRIRTPKISLYVGNYRKYGIVNLLVNDDFIELMEMLDHKIDSPITKLMTEFLDFSTNRKEYRENAVGPLFYMGGDICETKITTVSSLLLECAEEVNFISNEISDLYRIEHLLTLALCLYYAHEDLKSLAL
jgi:hypothetical protein